MAQKARGTQTDWQTQHENLLIEIDQLEQITEVMGDVLRRVKQQVSVLEETHLVSTQAKAPLIKKIKRGRAGKAKKMNIVH